MTAAVVADHVGFLTEVVVCRVCHGHYLRLEGSWFLDWVDVAAKHTASAVKERGNAITGEVCLEPL